ncbi:MAG: M23 family metallopeptidase [Lysobacteraceae bacterium]
MAELSGDEGPTVVTGRSQPQSSGQRPLHPVLRTILVFMVGALFGAVCTFFFVILKLPAMRPAAPVVQPSTVPATTPASPGPVVPEPSPQPQPSLPPDASGIQAGQRLLIPVEGIAAAQLTDTFDDARSQGRSHDAIDIMAPNGSRVLATADGTVEKLFNSERGGITLYEFDADQHFVFYYAHLAEYAPGIVEGKQIHQGELIGYVGSTGDASADAPHLHFEVSVLGPEKHWWRATSINPYPLLTGH